MSTTPVITSARYWRTAGRVARWSRWAGLVAATGRGFLIVQALVFIARGHPGAGPYLAAVTSLAAWTAAFLTPAWIILRRWERAAAELETAGTP